MFYRQTQFTFKLTILLSLMLLCLARYQPIVQLLSKTTLAPRIPLFIGSGYDILTGNPLSTEGLDPGFKHSIFDFSFNKGAKTEDGKYSIPDNLSHRKIAACSLRSTVAQYREARTYQQELRKRVQFGNGYQGLLLNAAFSQSSTFERIQAQTSQERLVLTQASAECQSYEMSLNIFKPEAVSQNFWEGVNFSLKTQNWIPFIEQFGTHFVHQTILGARATQQFVYTSQSVTQLSKQNIDINLIAQASFAWYFGDSSFDFNKYKKEIQYGEISSLNSYQFFIGGHPTKSGNIQDWYKSVIQNPMPISYRLLPLSDLFVFNPNKGIDSAKAKAQFLQALDKYCVTKKCRGPIQDQPKPKIQDQPKPKIQDQPKPKKATLKIIRTPVYGRDKGHPFQWHHADPKLNLNKVYIHSGTQIDRIQFEFSDGTKTVSSPPIGGNGGNYNHPWVISEHDYVDAVDYRTGDRVDSLKFRTKKGTNSPHFGGHGGYPTHVAFPDGYKIIGFYGEHGNIIHKIGFILGKVEYED